MSIPDEAMDEYFRLLLGDAGRPDGPPNQAKRELGRRIVDRFHGEGAGTGAEAAFDQVFRRACAPRRHARHRPRRLPGGERRRDPPAAADRGLVRISSSEARRLLTGGGVKTRRQSHWVPTRWTSRPRHWRSGFYRSGSGASQNFTARARQSSRESAIFRRPLGLPCGAPGV